ncbi:MAG: tetratricopeptide repeat protein, partial [Flavobacteriales bacterium]|nr:tetratricopeptide repeat protein [Flavobacteriales bacterium]
MKLKRNRTHKNEAKFFAYLIVALIFIMLTNTSTSYGEQNRTIDSLKMVIETAERSLPSSNGDGLKMKALGILAWKLYPSNPDTALQLATEGYHLAEKLEDKKYMTYCLRTQGTIHWSKSDYPGAMECFKKAVIIDESIGDKRALAGDYNNIGSIYNNQSLYPQSLKYFFKSLKLREELGNQIDVAGCYNNIGGIYSTQSDYPKALEYY